MANEIRSLSDTELVAAAVRVAASPLFKEEHLRLSPWERAFILNLPECFKAYASITWAQRKWARIVLQKVMHQLEARKFVADVEEEAQRQLA